MPIVPGFIFPPERHDVPTSMFPTNVLYELEILTMLDLMPAFGAVQDVFWSHCLILALVHFFFVFFL